MHTYPAKARTATDGTLSLAISTGLPDADVDVLVVVDPLPGTAANPPERLASWPAVYFKEYFGALRDEGIVRDPQGEPEDREPLS